MYLIQSMFNQISTIFKENSNVNFDCMRYKFQLSTKKKRLSEIYFLFDIVLYSVDRDVRDFPFKNIYKYGNINIFSVITTILDI